MIKLKWFYASLMSFLCFSSSLLAGGPGELVEFGEYVSTQTVFGGMVGYWSGNNQDRRFISGGETVYSSQGGWVAGAQNSQTPSHVLKTRSQSLSTKASNPEFGEYVSTQTVFGGMAGYWAGSADDMRFVSNGQVVYSNRGGWINGAGPNWAPQAPKSVFPEDVRIFKITTTAFQQVHGSLEADRLYLVQNDRNQTRMITRSYLDGGEVKLEMRPLASGTILYGSMVEKTGREASSKWKMENTGNGIQWRYWKDDPNNLISVQFKYEDE